MHDKWKIQRDNARAVLEHSCLKEVELKDIEDLNVPLDEMKAESIKFCMLGKFVQEVRDKKGQRYLVTVNYYN